MENITQSQIDNEEIRINLMYDMFSTYHILKKLDFESYKYIHQRVHDYVEDLTNFNITEKILSIFSDSMTTALFYDLKNELAYNINFDDKINIIDYSMELFNDRLNEKNEKIIENDVFSDMQNYTIFHYLINDSINKSIDDFVKKMFLNKKINEIFQQIVTTYASNLKKNILSTFKISPLMNSLYDIINQYCPKFELFNNEQFMYLSFVIPNKIIINNNSTKSIYTIQCIIGKGNFGYVLGYANDKGHFICLKFYYERNGDFEVVRKINEKYDLDNICIKSLCINKYNKIFEKDNIILYDDNNYIARKMEFLIMEYGEKIHSISVSDQYCDFYSKLQRIPLESSAILATESPALISDTSNATSFRQIYNVIKKVYKLYQNDIYFTDLKKNNIVYSKKNQDICFIDYDSFYFVEKSSSPCFSFFDLVSSIVPRINGKIKINRSNIHILNKIIVFMLSIFILEINNYDVNNLKKEEFVDKWKKYVSNNYQHLASDENIKILQNMYSYDINQIPKLENVYQIFYEINEKI
jgi:hypothetical protein